MSGRRIKDDVTYDRISMWLVEEAEKLENPDPLEPPEVYIKMARVYDIVTKELLDYRGIGKIPLSDAQKATKKPLFDFTKPSVPKEPEPPKTEPKKPRMSAFLDDDE